MFNSYNLIVIIIIIIVLTFIIIIIIIIIVIIIIIIIIITIIIIIIIIITVAIIIIIIIFIINLMTSTKRISGNSVYHTFWFGQSCVWLKAHHWNCKLRRSIYRYYLESRVQLC